MGVSDELRREIYAHFEQDMAGQVPESVHMLERYSPGALEGFYRLRRATTTESSLPWKVRELIIIAVEAALKKDPVGHARIAVEAGATPQEIHDAVALTLWLAGMPAYHHGMKAVRAAEEYAARRGAGGRNPVAPAVGRAASHAGQASPARRVQLVSAAAPGGGWYETCERTADVLRSEGLLPVDVEVVIRPGGLRVFEEIASEPAGDEHRLVAFSPGLTMQILMKGSRFSYADITPIAALCTDYGVITVPEASPFRRLGELLAAARKTGSVSVTGGSGLGAMHHGMVTALAAGAGLPPKALQYVSSSSVSEALERMVKGEVAAAALGAADVAEVVQRGQGRVLAVLASQRLPGILEDVPTAVEQEVPVVFPMWRGFYGPPGMSPGAVAFWVDVFTRMTATPSWQSVLRRTRWLPFFLTGDAFVQFLTEETARYREVLLLLQ